MPEAEIAVGGAIYGGWTSAEAARSIERAAATFRLGLTERWPGQATTRPIRPGESCAVRLDGELVITGHIDEVAPSHDSGGHGIEVSGRSLAGDLVDCSAASDPGEWHDAGLAAIAADICAPFSIPVSAGTAAGDPFRRFRIEEGETAWEAIERACRMRAVLATSRADGGLALVRAGTGRAGTDLRRGVNILSASAWLSWLDRHHRYTVLGQQPGNDFIGAEEAAHALGSAADPGVTRHRPLTLLAEQAADAGEATARAQWEASVRAARARRATVTVQGWRERPGGLLWAPNRVVRLADDWLAVDEDMLIVAVTYTFDEQGSRTQLTLAPPGAFELRREPEEENGTWWR